LTSPAPPRSRCVLGTGPWRTLHEALCARFPNVPGDEWQARLAAGAVVGEDGRRFGVDAPFSAGLVIFYTRSVPHEVEIPGDVLIVHADTQIIVADKPAGLPVMPTGPWVRQTLQWRVLAALGLEDAVPLHRLDRDTAGLVLLSVDPGSRAAYQALFRERRIRKVYEALGRPLPGRTMPFVHRSRLEPGEPFFRMRETDGEPNAETYVDVLERGSTAWRYRLEPVTGRKHQLRVQMAGLGAPLLGDALYPEIRPDAGPLALLARALEFRDPITGLARRFESQRSLAAAGD